MRGAVWVKETRREFVRERRCYLQQMKRLLNGLRIGCALMNPPFVDQVRTIEKALEEINAITKNYRA